jgi:pilin isopeptide linkage protein
MPTLVSNVTGITVDATVPVINEYDGASYQIPVKKLINEKEISITENSKTSETSKNDESSETSESSESTVREFSFTLVPADGKTSYTTQNCAAGTEFTTGTVSIKGTGETTFDRLYFKTSGTYEFTLTENDLATPADGYQKDQSTYHIKIVVSKKTNNGLEVTSATYTKDNDAASCDLTSSTPTFNNTYAASGSLTLKATKQLTGGRSTGITAGEFNFSVTENGNPVVSGSTNAAATADADGTYTADIAFDTIDYTANDIGTHTYLITENTGIEQGITYSSEAVLVKVVVSDDGKGHLTVTPTYPDGGAVFVNEYNAEGELQLHGVKIVMRRSADVKKDEFKFHVMENGSQVATGATLAGGNIEFTPIKYYATDVGTHTYKIIEEKGTDETIDYTADPVEVTVVVSDKGGG